MEILMEILMEASLPSGNQPSTQLHSLPSTFQVMISMGERLGSQLQHQLLDRVKPQLTTLLRILLLGHRTNLRQSQPLTLRLNLRPAQQVTQLWHQLLALHLRLHLNLRPDLPLNLRQSLRTSQLLCQRSSPRLFLSLPSLLIRLLLVLTTGLPQDLPSDQQPVFLRLLRPQSLLTVPPQLLLVRQHVQHSTCKEIS